VNSNDFSDYHVKRLKNIFIYFTYPLHFFFFVYLTNNATRGCRKFTSKFNLGENSMKKLVLALFVSTALLAVSTVWAADQGTKFEPVPSTDETTDVTLPPNPCSQAATSCCGYKYVKVVKYGCFGRKYYKIVKVYTVTDSASSGGTLISNTEDGEEIGTLAAPPEESGTIKGK
jgi:hypothetical protein